MPVSTTYSELTLRRKIAYILGFFLLCGIAFVLGVWFTFPDASLERRINAELRRQVPFRITVHQLERRLPLVLKGKEVEVDLPHIPLTITQFQIQPAWSSIIQFQPGFHTSGNIFGGPFRVQYTSSGATEIDARKMHLSADIPGFRSIRIEAYLEHAHFEGNISGAVTPHNAKINLKRVQIHGLDRVGLGQKVTKLGDLELTLESRERLVEVELLNPEGAFQLSGSGSITPPRLTPRGRLNLQLRIGNIPPEQAQLKELLQLAGVRKDPQGYLIRIGGRLQRPLIR